MLLSSSAAATPCRVFNGCRALLAPAKSAASPKPAAPQPKSKRKAKTSPPTLPRRPAGIVKPVPVSPALRDFLGVPEASRTDAVKKIWAYVKHNNLQNPANKREIFCDEKLNVIFDGKDKVGFLEVGKLLSQHFVRTV
uniref:Uncharacterized protein MANES_09G133600 n=1 Tax=Rhizophora mucronata TaxID=61149 RepID=A0A2P2NG42_RHIMU